jgi:hypothetical protein
MLVQDTSAAVQSLEQQVAEVNERLNAQRLKRHQQQQQQQQMQQQQELMQQQQLLQQPGPENVEELFRLAEMQARDYMPESGGSMQENLQAIASGGGFGQPQAPAQSSRPLDSLLHWGRQ